MQFLNAKRAYKAASAVLSSDRWRRVYNFGARTQRLLWANTGTKEPKASDIPYIKALAAPYTVHHREPQHPRLDHLHDVLVFQLLGQGLDLDRESRSRWSPRWWRSALKPAPGAAPRVSPEAASARAFT